jgi:hypothetical protein
MKRLIISSLILLFLANSFASGQAALLVLIFGDKAATEKFHFSLKAGATYSIIHGYDEGDNGLGINFGLVNNIKLSDKFSLIPEFLPLAPRSVRNIPTLSTGDPNLDDLLNNPTSTSRKFNYIDIPVMLRWHINDRFSLASGPSISILISATDTYESSPLNDVVLRTDLDVMSMVNPIDIGAVIDFQYALVPPIKGKGINIYARYYKGFLDMVDVPGSKSYTSSLIQFGAAFPFLSKDPE